MREIYDMTVFAADADDYETEGLCGPLAPLGEPEVTIEAGGEYCLDFEHPYDPEGRWRALATGNTVRAWVQMRVPPEPDDMGAYAATVEVWKVRSTAGKTDRYLYSTRADTQKTKKLKLLKGGLKVTIVNAYAEGRWKVKTKYGTGWMNQEGLDGSEAETDAISGSDGLDDILGVDFRPQLFDITEVERTHESVLVHAMHSTYRLMKNVTRYVATGSVKGVTAAKRLLANCLDEHEFSAYSDVADVRAGASWNYVNPIEAIMDPEAGLMARWGMELLRDNFDLYLLHNVGRDRGVTIEVGRNLAGITVTEDVTGIATYVMPLGTKADGSPLLLPEVWLVSPRANQYPQKHIYAFWADDAQVDDDASTATVRGRMREQAQAMLDAGCDVPALTVSVEVAQVDDPRAEAVVEALEPVLEYDTVRVYDVDRGLAFEDKCIRRVVDPVHGRLLSMELGNTRGRLGGTQIATWQVPNGFSGGKVAPGTLDGAALKDSTLQLRTIIAGSIIGELIAGHTITADHLAAGAVDAQALTAVTAAIGDLTAEDVHAGTVEANTLAAAFARLAAIVAEDISAGTVTADTLTAAIVDAQKATARTADFDVETVTHLIGSVLQVTGLIEGRLARIENLYVTQANLANAVLDRLAILGTDGLYYDVAVGSDGMVSASVREVTQEEADAGETGDGKGIVPGAYDIETLADHYIDDPESELRTLYVEALSAGKITATQAFIGSARVPELEATVIRAVYNEILLAAEDAVRVLLGNAEQYNAAFDFTPAGLRTRIAGSKWSTLVTNDGYHIDHDEVQGHVGSFHEDTFEPRSIRMGTLVCKPTSGGGWAWKRA